MTKTGHTILLAEEDDATRAFLQDNLSCDGYGVKAAEGSAKAIALLSTAHPDLIVVDVNGQTAASTLTPWRLRQRLSAHPQRLVINVWAWGTDSWIASFIRCPGDILARQADDSGDRAAGGAPIEGRQRAHTTTPTDQPSEHR